MILRQEGMTKILLILLFQISINQRTLEVLSIQDKVGNNQELVLV